MGSATARGETESEDDDGRGELRGGSTSSEFPFPDRSTRQETQEADDTDEGDNGLEHGPTQGKAGNGTAEWRVKATGTTDRMVEKWGHILPA